MGTTLTLDEGRWHRLGMRSLSSVYSTAATPPWAIAVKKKWGTLVAGCPLSTKKKCSDVA